MKQVIEGAFLGLVAMLLGLAICVVLPPAANAQGGTQADEIADFDDLVQWQADNPAGGTITLTGDIEIADYSNLANMHINTGDYGLNVSGELVLYADVTITGSGIDNPLVRVREGGALHLIGINTFIVNGAGGTALHFEAVSNLLEDDTSRLNLRAEEPGSVAIYTETPLNFKRCTIEAGAGAGLITATEPVRLYLSKVEAQGPVALSSNITLDTCQVSSAVTQANIISRKITQVTSQYKFFFAAGEETQGCFEDKKVRCFLTLSAEGEEDLIEPVLCAFADTFVNYDKPGEYTMPGEFAPPYDEFYALDILSEACPVQIPVTVYDPSIPYYYDSKFIYGVLVVNYYYSGAHEALTLWRSDDDGKSWQTYWRPGDEGSDTFEADYNDYSIDLMFLNPAELTTPALFVFEVGKGKGSDILYVDAAAIVNYGYGGDRDSGDRILLPWEFFFGNPNDDGDGGDDDGTQSENTGGGKNSPPNAGEGGSGQGTDYSGAAVEPDDFPDISKNNGNSEISAIAATTAQRASEIKPDAANDVSPAATPIEYENETTIAISGKRLEALMLTNAQMVPFARQDVQVWIPTSVLANLQLVDTDIFTLQIQTSVQSEISIMFFINDSVLSEPFTEAFLVGIPWAETNEIINCTNSSGTVIPFEYDKQNGLLILTLFECGTYIIEAKTGSIGVDAAKNDDITIHGITIEDMAAPIEENAVTSYVPFAILAVGAAGASSAGGIAYTLRKRRTRGGR